jgi:diadenosine tetraphosphate (Ap4A) HIT family hydrolase
VNRKNNREDHGHLIVHLLQDRVGWGAARPTVHGPDTIAFMDQHPANDGHCLVIPKTLYQTIFKMPPEDSAALARTVVKITARVQRGAAARRTEPGPGEWSDRRTVGDPRKSS